MYFVYVLKLSDGSFYTGYSEDLNNRIAVHNKGGVISTKHKRPVEFIWYCGFKDKKKAIKLEKYLKTASGIAIRNKHFI